VRGKRGRTTLSGTVLINELDLGVKVVRLSYTSKEMTKDVLTHRAWLRLGVIWLYLIAQE
jgi:hypothetical protein